MFRWGVFHKVVVALQGPAGCFGIPVPGMKQGPHQARAPSGAAAGGAGGGPLNSRHCALWVVGVPPAVAFPPAPTFATCRGCGAGNLPAVSPLVVDAPPVDACISGRGTDTTGGPQSALLGGFGSRRFAVARDGVTIAGGGLPLLCGLPQFCARRRDDARAASSPKVLRKGPDPPARLGLRGAGYPIGTCGRELGLC